MPIHRRVLDPPQVQADGRSGGAGEAPIACSAPAPSPPPGPPRAARRATFRRCCAPCGAGRRSPRSRATHSRPRAAPRSASTRLTVVFDWHSTERKAREIVLADQRLRRGVHGRCVERTMDPGRPRALQTPSARCDSICSNGRCGESPCAARESPSVTSPAHCRAIAGASLVLAPSTQARGGAHGVGVEMNDLAEGVHAAVGAAGADGDDGMTGDEG